MTEKMKILCLHGMHQNAEVFKTRLGRLPHKSREYATFRLLDGPFLMDLKEGDDLAMRSWYRRDDETFAIDENTMVSCVEHIRQVWEAEGPFDGVLGFSQGGCVAAMLSLMPTQFPSLKFVICFSARDLPVSIIGSLRLQPRAPDHVKSLHMFGTEDKVVPLDSSLQLASEKFMNAVTVQHPQGHCIPMSAKYQNDFVDFIKIVYGDMHGGNSHDISSAAVGKVEDVKQTGKKGSSAGVTKAKKRQAFNNKKVASTDNSTVIASLGENLKASSLSNSDTLVKVESDKETIKKTETVINKKKQEHRCASDDMAAQQAEEIEALEAIFANDVQIVQPAPTKSGELCGAVRVTLKTVSDEEGDFITAVSPAIPAHWVDQLHLVVQMTESYPEISSPEFRLTTGTLGLMDFTTDMQEALLNAVQHVAEANIGSGVVYQCVCAANEWIQIGIGAHAQVKTGGVITAPAEVVKRERGGIKAETAVNVAEIDGEEEEDVVKEQEMVTIATKEACLVNAAIMRSRQQQQQANSSSCGNFANDCHIEADNDEDEEEVDGEIASKIAANDTSHLLHSGGNTASSKGVWNYTVGLIGKPSVGKSSFYNAATAAALVRDGRKMAEVAAHPFTTIEPNVGPGWYAGPMDGGGGGGGRGAAVAAAAAGSEMETATRSTSSCVTRGAAHGRDPSGRRLLPIVLKDVAGLVPGSYKGRGKGNRFLADLCDADVLIHVIDVTGKSDRDGNVLLKEENDDHVGNSNGIGSSSSNSHRNGTAAVQLSPSDDAQWIREELHRWIYGNIKAKWQSVIRKQGKATGPTGKHSGSNSSSSSSSSGGNKEKAYNRVVALFSGYKGSKSCVARALTRMQYNLKNIPTGAGTGAGSSRAGGAAADNATAATAAAAVASSGAGSSSALYSSFEQSHLWTNQDLHRLVAHYLAIRFPVCLALNKVDDFGSSSSTDTAESVLAAGKAVVEHCCAEARLRGEVAVPVSARAANWELMKKARSCGNTGGKNNGGSPKQDAEEEAILQRVLADWGGDTGVMKALSAAVALRPPVLCYPVSDLDSEMPLGWSAGGAAAASTASGGGGVSADGSTGTDGLSSLVSAGSNNSASPHLRDCLLLKPGSTVQHVFIALKRGALPHVVVQGEFVRAEGRGLEPSSRKKQVGRDVVVDSSNCVLRVQTNRKSVWQQSISQ